MSLSNDNRMLTSPVFEWNYNSTKPFIVNAGGTSSGKTVSIMQAIGVKLTQKKLLATVVADTIPKLKKGALRDFQDYCLPHIKHHVKSYNISERIYLFKNGSQIEFASYDNEQSARNGKRDILFINEANGITWMVAWQLIIRTKLQCFFDYNPSASFWVHDRFVNDTDKKSQTDYFISDHRHNPFLPQFLRDQIESIKDPEMYKVYARGQLGKLAGQIYNWNVCDVLPVTDNIVWGLDFGYTNDPTALTKIAYIKEGKQLKNVFVHECSYTPGISPVGIVSLLEANGYKKGQHVLCDHDNDMVTQLRRLGISATNAHKSDLQNGILWLKQQNVYYTKSSINIKNEIERYVWLENKDSTSEADRYSNTPIDSFNHCMDSIRYGLYSMHIFQRL